HDHAMHPQLLVARGDADLVGKVRPHRFGRLHRSYPRKDKARLPECKRSQFLEAGLGYFAGEVYSRDFGPFATDADPGWHARVTTDEEVHRLANTAARLGPFGRGDHQLPILSVRVSAEPRLANDHLGENGRWLALVGRWKQPRIYPLGGFRRRR